MKVWIETADTSPESLGGKSLFCKRLADELRKRNIEVTSDASKRVDVALNVVHATNKNARVKVLRIDGVWHDTGKNYAKKNASIQEAIDASDAVVYQSYFARGMADAFLKRQFKTNVVIYNGTRLDLCDGTPPAKVDGGVAITVAKWRPHKRLKDTVEAFLLADVGAKLHVFGELSKSGLLPREINRYAATGRVVFHGHVDQPTLLSYLEIATCNVHLCWFDACPNSVIEALCAGVPVVTNNVGGTRELVTKACPEAANWLVCNIDAAYACNPIDLYHPPAIDREIVASAIRRCFSSRIHVNCKALSIQQSADQYLKFMEALCNPM